MQKSKDLSLDEYTEMIYYCRSCHSLYILKDATLADKHWDGTYCGKCGSSHIGECMFGKWLEKEEEMEERKKQREWNK